MSKSWQMSKFELIIIYNGSFQVSYQMIAVKTVLHKSRSVHLRLKHEIVVKLKYVCWYNSILHKNKIEFSLYSFVVWINIIV